MILRLLYFINLNYLPMKQFIAKTRVIMMALVFGALFFVSSEASAQASSTSVSPPPNNNQSWVSISEANQTVESEIAALTQQLGDLIQNQAPKSEITPVKLQLHFFLLVQENLNQGMLVSEALKIARDNIAGLDSIKPNPKRVAKAQEIYDEAATMLSF